ncbi:glycosyltransferase family 2 protein [Coraliomargarita sp. W4R53]
MSETIRVKACLTAFNRKEKTCAALRAFFGQTGGYELSAVLVDDGSTDGTGEVVRSEFSQTSVVCGDGNLFWNGGMSRAFDLAREEGADFYLWLNDDTFLLDDALHRLISDLQKLNNPKGAIVVGSTQDPDTKVLSYGGVRRTSKWHPGKFEMVEPGPEALPCDAMNGNVVLVSAEAARMLGSMDGHYTHSMGDYDYGLRAGQSGISVFVGEGYHGYCPRNPTGAAWHERESIGLRLQAARSPKGLPFREWAYFLRKHGNLLWPLAWCATYRKIITG